MKFKTLWVAALSGWIMGMVVNVSASEVLTRVHAVQPGASPTDAMSVLSTLDGRVYSIPGGETAAIALLEAAVRNQSPVRLELSADENTILEASLANPQDARLYQDDFTQAGEDTLEEKLLFPLPTGYNATITRSDAETERLFQSLTTRTRGTSQCYQRASYWARHLATHYGTRSMKVFLFMTEAYRTLAPPRGEPAHRWWFHVAPMIYQQMADGTVEERVLDRGWPRAIPHAPNLNDWTSVFIDTGKQCRVIDSYQSVLDMQADWRRNAAGVRRDARHLEHCMMRIVPMYYYQPNDLEALDIRGVQHTAWMQYSLRNHHCAVDFCM